MENLLYTYASSDALLMFIAQQRKSYKINIDFKDYVKYYDSDGGLISHYVLNSVFVKHTQITPIYKVIKRTKTFNVVKIIIPEFTIYLPQYHNIKYTFNESTLNLMIEKSNFTIEYDDVIEFFDNGISNYLERTIDDILSRNFISTSGRSILCTDYKVKINHNYIPFLEG